MGLPCSRHYAVVNLFACGEDQIVGSFDVKGSAGKVAPEIKSPKPACVARSVRSFWKRGICRDVRAWACHFPVGFSRARNMAWKLM